MGFQGRLYRFVFHQYCIPSRVKKWFDDHLPTIYLFFRNGRFNINTAEYWDRRWKYPDPPELEVFQSPRKLRRICLVGV
jgi:hypothetical protein